MLNLRNIEILLTVMSHFDVTGVKILFYSLVVLRECSYSKLEVPWQLKNVPPNATALECIKCTLGGITLAEPHNFRGLAPSVKAGRYFSCYTTSVTLQSTPNARSAEGKASPPSAPAVAGTYRRIGARQPHFLQTQSCQNRV